jgi:hypothetical protein
MNSITISPGIGDTLVSSSKVFVPVSRSATPSPVSRSLASTGGVSEYLPPFLTIQGSLPKGRKFAKPLDVMIEYSDDEVVVSERRFYIHASGSTVGEALAAFRRIFSEYLDVLSSEKENLDSYMLSELQYLRSSIASV